MRVHSPNATSWLLAAALFCCYPLALLVPPAWAWENGIIEEGDVVLLSAGCAWAVFVWISGREREVALLARCAVPIWAILIGRELSWGATLFTPASMTAEGPIFTSHALWYRPFVTPVLVALTARSIWSAIRCRLDRQVYGLLTTGRFPWPPTLVLLAAAVGSSYAEGHLSGAFCMQHGQSVEELMELVGYCALVVVQARVLRECTNSSRAFAAAAPMRAR